MNGERHSNTHAMWAKPCNDWSSKGSCSRGVSCFYKHEGFPIYDASGGLTKRCLVCGATGHTSDKCNAHGGGLDPDKEKHWSEYKNIADTKRGTTTDDKGKGKGKGK